MPQSWLDPARLRDAFFGVWALIGVGVVAVVVWRIVSVPLGPLTPAIVIAALTTYVYATPVRWLVSRGWRRSVAAVTLLGGSLLVVLTLLALLAPLVARQAGGLLDSFPQILATVQAGVNQTLAAAGFTTTIDLDISKPEVVAELTDLLVGRDGQVEGIVALLGSAAHRISYLMVGLVAGPLAALYLLIDLPRVSAGFRELLHERVRDDVLDMGRIASEKVGAYLRGQLIVSSFVGVATTIAMAAVGLPAWAAVGFVAGVTNLVPLLGPLVGGAIGVIVALTVGGGVGQAVLVAVLMLIIQQVESSVLGPHVMGRAVKMRPLTVLVVLSIAGPVGGIPAMVVAVPTVATVTSIVNQIRARRRAAREALLAGPDPGDPAAGLPPAGCGVLPDDVPPRAGGSADATSS